MVFSEVREYQFGDDIRQIDWNVTARTGEPYVKIFEEEREQTLMLCVIFLQAGYSEEKSAQTGFNRRIMCGFGNFSAINKGDKVGMV